VPELDMERKQMRYVLAICLVCLIGTPAAFATPQISSGTALMGKADTAVESVKHKLERLKHKRSPSRRSHGLGGIHPLVGSGDY
jgi:hypothetical protein